jgi:hypothetical protein
MCYQEKFPAIAGDFFVFTVFIIKNSSLHKKNYCIQYNRQTKKEGPNG